MATSLSKICEQSLPESTERGCDQSTAETAYLFHAALRPAVVLQHVLRPESTRLGTPYMAFASRALNHGKRLQSLGFSGRLWRAIFTSQPRGLGGSGMTRFTLKTLSKCRYVSRKAARCATELFGSL